MAGLLALPALHLAYEAVLLVRDQMAWVLALVAPVTALTLILTQERDRTLVATPSPASPKLSRSPMNADATVPLLPSHVTLETRFSDFIVVTGGDASGAVLDELHRTLTRLGIHAERLHGEGSEVLRYRCTVRDAFRLRYGRSRPDELERALMREYPWLAASEAELRARVATLRASFERMERAGAPDARATAGVGRRARRRASRE